LLPARFQQALESQVVRHATLVLREGSGNGELRLVLKPETLGNVRIKLSMTSGRIEGQIIVENSNIKELFDAALPGIQAGLREEGFGSAALEVAVGHRQPGGRREGKTGNAHRISAAEFEIQSTSLDMEESLINLIV
jgi:flagellar hook-length control protein FliK